MICAGTYAVTGSHKCNGLTNIEVLVLIAVVVAVVVVVAVQQ